MTKDDVLREYEELQKLEEKLRQVAQDVKNKKAGKAKFEQKKKDMMVEGYVEEKGTPTKEMSAILGDIKKSENEIEQLQEIRDGLVDRVSGQNEKFKKVLDGLKREELEKLDAKAKNLEAEVEGVNKQLRKLYKEQAELKELQDRIHKCPESLIEKEVKGLTKKPKVGQITTDKISPLSGEGKTMIMPQAKRR